VYSEDELNPETIRWAKEMTRIGQQAVKRAVQECRDFGVPIAFTSDDDQICYELPDGTIVTDDPWHGQKTPPADWPWRDRWEKNVAQKLEERRKRAAGWVGDQ
jgi:hypothetical protein